MSKIVLHRINFESRDFTYGSRIALGDIFGASGVTEYGMLKNAFRELYGFSARLLPVRWRVRAFNHIIAGLTSWIEKEQKMLQYTPSSDELAAGVKELGEKVGNMATIKALAKAYSKDPDEILEWDYAKVFGILYTDLEERKYETKLNKRIYGRSGSHKFGN